MFILQLESESLESGKLICIIKPGHQLFSIYIVTHFSASVHKWSICMFWFSVQQLRLRSEWLVATLVFCGAF